MKCNFSYDGFCDLPGVATKTQCFGEIDDRCGCPLWKKQYVGANEIQQAILGLPDKIAAKSKELAGITEILEEKRADAVKKRVQVMAQITSEYGSDGKAKYTNDKARDAARDIALDHDQEYQTLLYEIKTGENAKSDTQIDLELLQNKFRAYLAICHRVEEVG